MLKSSKVKEREKETRVSSKLLSLPGVESPVLFINEAVFDLITPLLLSKDWWGVGGFDREPFPLGSVCLIAWNSTLRLHTSGLRVQCQVAMIASLGILRICLASLPDTWEINLILPAPCKLPGAIACILAGSGEMHVCPRQGNYQNRKEFLKANISTSYKLFPSDLNIE